MWFKVLVGVSPIWKGVSRTSPVCRPCWHTVVSVEWLLFLLQLHIFGPDFQALILVFPDDGGVEVEEFDGEGAGAGEELLGLLGGIFVGAVVIARALALAIIPMGHGVDGAVFG